MKSSLLYIDRLKNGKTDAIEKDNLIKHENPIQSACRLPVRANYHDTRMEKKRKIQETRRNCIRFSHEKFLTAFANKLDRDVAASFRPISPPATSRNQMVKMIQWAGIRRVEALKKLGLLR